MKKLIFSLAVLFFCVPSFAQLAQGNQLIGARLGLGFQLENSGVSYSDYSRVDWGSLGAEYGLSYYYLVTDKVGIGADVSYGDFEGGDLFVSSDKVNDRTRLFNTFLSARFTSNPSSAFRLYMPMGIGITTSHQHLHIDKGGTKYENRVTDTSLGWFVGGGFEFDFGRGSDWSMGLEARYNAFSVDTDRLTRNAPPAVKGVGNRHLSYMSFHLRVNKRF